MKIVASLMALKEFTVEHAAEGLSDKELELMIAEMRERRAKLVEQPKETPLIEAKADDRAAAVVTAAD